MRRLVILLTAVFLLGLVAPTVRAESLLVVLNKSDHTAALVNPRTLEVLATVPTGQGPHEAAASQDGKYVYVANYGVRGAEGNTLTVIDVPGRKVVRTINLGEFKRPHGIHASRDGKTVWVTCEANQAVLGIDTSSGRIAENYRTGQQVSHMVVAAKDEQKLYVANIGSGTVTIIDRMSGQVKSLPTGAGAEGIDISPDGKSVWITNRSDNTISVLDTASETIVAILKAGGEMPIRVKFTPDGRQALVSNARSNSLSVFDSIRRQETSKIETGSAPAGILIIPDGSRAFVANTQSNQVSVVDLEERKVVRTFQTGTEPDGMAWVP